VRFVKNIMPSSSRSASQLAQLVTNSGLLAEFCCDYCFRSNQLCIVSSFSQRCAACLYRNQRCSLSQELRVSSDPSSSNSQRSDTAYSELLALIIQLRSRVEHLESLVIRPSNGSFDHLWTLILLLDNVNFRSAVSGSFSEDLFDFIFVHYVVISVGDWVRRLIQQGNMKYWVDPHSFG